MLEILMNRYNIQEFKFSALIYRSLKFQRSAEEFTLPGYTNNDKKESASQQQTSDGNLYSHINAFGNEVTYITILFLFV